VLILLCATSMNASFDMWRELTIIFACDSLSGLNSSVCLGQTSYALRLKCSDPLVIAIVDVVFGVDDWNFCKQECCVASPQCLEPGDSAVLAGFGCTGGSTCSVQNSRFPIKELSSCNNATASFLHVSYECVNGKLLLYVRQACLTQFHAGHTAMHD